jgi:hypothetical protein
MGFKKRDLTTIEVKKETKDIGHVTIKIKKEVENIVVITLDIKEEVEGVFIIPFKIEKEIKELEKIEIMQKKVNFEWHIKTNPRIHNQVLKCQYYSWAKLALS